MDQGAISSKKDPKTSSSKHHFSTNSHCTEVTRPLAWKLSERQWQKAASLPKQQMIIRKILTNHIRAC